MDTCVQDFVLVRKYRTPFVFSNLDFDARRCLRCLPDPRCTLRSTTQRYRTRGLNAFRNPLRNTVYLRDAEELRVFIPAKKPVLG